VPADGPDSKPAVPSLYPLWKAAFCMEREAYDLVGVHYEGHPDLRRILLPWDWVGHPLRKDQPLGGQEVPFSMIWNDPDFATLGQQILDPAPTLAPLPKGVDPSKHLMLNMGPHHPATHGVLRIAAGAGRREVISAHPDTGYLHSGFEKQGEHIRYKDLCPTPTAWTTPRHVQQPGLLPGRGEAVGCGDSAAQPGYSRGGRRAAATSPRT
jgi:hypothetical protein